MSDPGEEQIAAFWTVFARVREALLQTRPDLNLQSAPTGVFSPITNEAKAALAQWVGCDAALPVAEMIVCANAAYTAYLVERDRLDAAIKRAAQAESIPARTRTLAALNVRVEPDGNGESTPVRSWKVRLVFGVGLVVLVALGWWTLQRPLARPALLYETEKLKKSRTLAPLRTPLR
jgi:hypothetical protein